MKLFCKIKLLVLGIAFVQFPVLAQDILFQEPITAVADERVNSIVKKDVMIKIVGLSVSYNGSGYPVADIVAKTEDGTKTYFEAKQINKFTFKEANTTDKVWTKHLLKSGTYINLLTNGYQYALRKEKDDESAECLNGLALDLYHDKYVEDYLYTLANKIHIGILKDKRPGNIFIKIIKEAIPSARTLSNGCIILSTGLLSTIQSEDELVGVLAHEIAHFVLDHQILNSKVEEDRKERALFWSTFATAVAASADVYLAVNNKNYIPGVLTASTLIGATLISEEVTKRLGINYSQQQELDADEAAKEILAVLKYNKYGLSVALGRIRRYCEITGNFIALSASGSHPSLEARINSLGLLDSIDYFIQEEYFKKVSSINTYNAKWELEYAHHLAANELVSRNINCGMATEFDYIIKAAVKRRLLNTKESNEEVLAYLDKAKSLNINTPIMLYKEEAISLLRLNKRTEAKKALQTYLGLLQGLRNDNDIHEIKNYNKKIFEEIDWTKEMIFKVDNM